MIGERHGTLIAWYNDANGEGQIRERKQGEDKQKKIILW